MVPELGRYKAVARLKGRAVLVGIWASEAEVGPSVSVIQVGSAGACKQMKIIY